jgi:hypothetical protein
MLKVFNKALWVLLLSGFLQHLVAVEYDFPINGTSSPYPQGTTEIMGDRTTHNGLYVFNINNPYGFTIRVGTEVISEGHTVASNPTLTEWNLLVPSNLAVGDYNVTWDSTFASTSPQKLYHTTFSFSIIPAPALVVSKNRATVSESGTTESFTVKLSTKPGGNVVVNLSSGDTEEATVAPATLTFSDSNWSTPQTVTIIGVDDSSLDGNQDVDVTIAVDDANSDDNYDPVADVNVTVTNVDNDTLGITVTPTALTVYEPSGEATFSITLNSEPTADVNITTITPNAQCTTSHSSMLISASSWNQEHNVTVQAVDDADDGNQTCTITVDNSESSDSNYHGLNPDDVSVNVVSDNKAASMNIDVNISEDENSSEENNTTSEDENSTESSSESSSEQSSSQSSSSQSSEESSSSESSSSSGTIEVSRAEAPIGFITSFFHNQFLHWQVAWSHHNTHRMLVRLVHKIRIILRTRANESFDSLVCSIDGVADENLCSIDAEGQVIFNGEIDPDSNLTIEFRTPAHSDIERVEVSATGMYDENGDGGLDSGDANVVLSNNNYTESVEPSVVATSSSSSSESSAQSSSAQTSATQEVAIPFMDNLAKLLMIFGFFGLALLFLRRVK